MYCIFFPRDKEHTKDVLAKAEREHWKVVEAMEAFMKVHKIERWTGENLERKEQKRQKRQSRKLQGG